MLYLLLSIGTTTLLFILFKVFERQKVDLFSAIVVNYAVAAALGSVLIFPKTIIPEGPPGEYLLLLALGALFISLFVLLGRTAQNQGISIAVTANKMSLIIPVLLAFVLLGESIQSLQLMGIFVALTGIALTLYRPSGDKVLSGIIWPLIVFAGSGLIDFLLKYGQHHYLEGEHDFLAFTSGIFFVALVFGLIYGLATRQFRLSERTLLYGALLGVPNFFSIYFLLLALGKAGMESTVLLPVNNSSVLLLSTLLSMLLFKEKLSTLNRIGVLISLGAIFLILYGS
ncbi:EamA family transporter [bacterium SCSIO 12741]|nr:EamA family transporter [bacterium SCSIO 12741]